MHDELTAHETACRLALIRAPGLSTTRINSLLQSFGNARAVLAAGRGRLRDAVPESALEGILAPDWQRIREDLAWQQEGARDTGRRHILLPGDTHWPAALEAVPDPPPLLFVVGDPEVLGQPQLAIVGSRNATRGGLDNARAFAAHLAARGLVITSGLARGIDGAAHRGALEAGGLTVAVAGTGPDRIYPAAHRDLAREVVGEGALVTEFPPGTAPLAANFPRRNRIISGLSIGTLVVEAAPRSGSLITARLAMEQGREVFAIPGSIHNPLARGCHRLIRDGARLVEAADDILEELAGLLPVGQIRPAPSADSAEGSAEPSPDEDPEYARLRQSMGYDPVTLDMLVQRSGLTPEQVSSMLLLMELRGQVESAPGGRYTLAGTRS